MLCVPYGSDQIRSPKWQRWMCLRQYSLLVQLVPERKLLFSCAIEQYGRDRLLNSNNPSIQHNGDSYIPPNICFNMYWIFNIRIFCHILTVRLWWTSFLPVMRLYQSCTQMQHCYQLTRHPLYSCTTQFFTFLFVSFNFLYLHCLYLSLCSTYCLKIS